MSQITKNDEIVTHWKKTLNSEHTSRAYSQAIACLENFSQKSLGNISEADVMAFAEFMNRAKTPSATFNLRMAAINNFFTFLAVKSGCSVTKLPIVKFKGQTISCPKAVFTFGQCQSLIRAIPNTLQGKRDFALLLGVICMHNLSPSAWCALSWGDFQKIATPVPVHQAVMAFVEESGRLGTIAASQAVFTRLVCTSERFRHLRGNSPRHDHISTRQLHSLITKYAGKVGLGGSVNARVLHQAGKELHARALSDTRFFHQLGLRNSCFRIDLMRQPKGDDGNQTFYSFGVQ